MTFDPDRIVDRILEIFVGEGNNWLTFRQLAHRITGDPSKEYVIAGVVHQYGKVFATHNDRSCKIRAEFIEGAAKVKPPADVPPEPLYIEAARCYQRCRTSDMELAWPLR